MALRRIVRAGSRRRLLPHDFPPWEAVWRGHGPAVHVTPVNEQEARVFESCEAVRTVTGRTVEQVWADQGRTGGQPRRDAQVHGIALQVIRLAEAKRGFVLLPRRWVVERSFAWAARFRRLARDGERMPGVLRGLHFLVFALLVLPQAIPWLKATGNCTTRFKPLAVRGLPSAALEACTSESSPPATAESP